MDIGTISARYAKALIAYAQEQGVEEKLYRELKSLNQSLSTVPQLRAYLEIPMLDAEEKFQLIKAATVGDAEPSKEFVRFIRLVIKQRREIYLHFISMSYMSLYFKTKRIAVGTLTTAVPIDEKTKTRIKETASAVVHAKMKLYSVVDPSIEGGFLFDINDFRLDASVATQLKKVKQQFIDKNRRIV